MLKSIARLLVLTVAVIGGAIAVPTAASASPATGAGIQSYTDCGQWQFGFWDHPDGKGPVRCWGGTIDCGTWLDLNRLDYPFGGSWRDRIESIQNKTSATMGLDNWNSATRRWDRLWTSVPGNWGNLPVGIRNATDRIIRVC
ncbi:peptidase inhibitor family I36 protein [Amycolatopsis japonica]|uniref:peptidase inhibitor family I36 protein n=1 Tax=Amycolatopsis japonica TaxID=208439 RepID=UPI0033E96241